MHYTKEIYDGQKQINGALCRADWKLIQALRLVHNILTDLRPHVPQDVLDQLDRAINEADDVSRTVASIKPPGCEPEAREDPTYTHAATNSTSTQP